MSVNVWSSTTFTVLTLSGMSPGRYAAQLFLFALRRLKRNVKSRLVTGLPSDHV